MNMSSIDSQIKELQLLMISTKDLKVRVETQKYIDNLYDEMYDLEYNLENEFYEKNFDEFEDVFTVDSDQYN